MAVPEEPARNPHVRFQWPEYMEATARAREAEQRILVIGNSQTYGQYMPEELIWTRVLERELNEASGPRSDYRIINWGLMGGNANHLALLDFYTELAAPEHCFVVLTYGSFNTSFPEPDTAINPLLYDLAYLAYGTEIHHAPDSWLDRNHSLNLRWQDQLRRYWPTYRFRTLPLSWLAAHGPKVRVPIRGEDLPPSMLKATSLERELPLFTAAEREGWYHLTDPTAAGIALAADSPVPSGMASYMRRKWWIPTLRPVDELCETIASSPVPHTIVLMPVWNGECVIPAADKVRIRERLDAAVAYHGLDLVDLTEALPPEAFLDPYHLNGNGHRTMAEEMRLVMESRGMLEEDVIVVEARQP